MGDDLTTHFLTTWSPIEVQGERPEEQRQWRSGSGGAARAGGAVGGRHEGLARVKAWDSGTWEEWGTWEPRQGEPGAEGAQGTGQ